MFHDKRRWAAPKKEPGTTIIVIKINEAEKFFNFVLSSAKKKIKLAQTPNMEHLELRAKHSATAKTEYN